jgi:transposase
VPPRPVRELRELTRYRKTQIQERSREVQRLDKVLQDAGIKLSSVATDIIGASGRAMLEALVGGTHDPQVLTALAKGRLRAKLPALREALAGRFRTEHHGLLVAQILAHIDYLDETIALLSARIQQVIAPYAEQVALLDTIPGVDRRAAKVIVAEIGADMGQFPTAAHLASWAGVCPGNNESAGKHRSGQTRKGSKWLGGCLSEVAKAASRTKGTYLNAQYHRLRGRRGPGKATMAVAHSVLVIADHILDQGVASRSWATTTSSSASPPSTTSVNSSASSNGLATRSPWNRSRRPDLAPTQPDIASEHFQLSRGVPAGTPCGRENGAGCPPTPVRPWPLEAVIQSGAGARQQGRALLP